LRQNADEPDRKVSVMDIIIGRKPPVRKDSTNATVPIHPAKKVLQRDQRKNQQDRRKSVRDGVFVSLSFMKERRKSRDRRKMDYHAWA
jgi:hypothetical protein